MINDTILFGVVPYIAVVVFLVVTIQRYRQRSFTYSSLSSQFLENQQHFWGSVPFHYGILFVLSGHVLAWLAPRSILWWNAEPLRLFALEITGLALAVLALVGLVNMLVRRWRNVKARVVTTASDWVLNALLLLQITSGVAVAIVHGWGSSWFATSISPWLWSLVRLNPEVAWIAPMPWLVKLHVFNAWLLIGFFPFTRLVHILVVPNPYLWRKTQVVLWNWDRAKARATDR
jgi:nitrate reductase gamma subunit